MNFTSAAAVGNFFGTASNEYFRALFYFGWISKNITTPQQLSFWFWNNDVATDSLIWGNQTTFSLSTFTSISAGDFTLTMAGVTHHITGINLSAAGSLATVAADLQTAIRAADAGWTSATVTYNAAAPVGAQFNLNSGVAGADTITVTAGVSTDVAGPLGWLTGAILSNGTTATTLTQNLNNLINISNNFGSFCLGFVSSQTEQNCLDAANWNASLTPNMQFMYSIQVSSANASSWSAAFLNINGCTLTLVSPVSTEYPEMVPMMILAATDYTERASVQNYMFQVFQLTPSVTTGAQQQLYDGLRINYYGQTETAGQLLNFYQRGVMMGLPVSPSDQNVFANEIWFKDGLGAAIGTLLLSLSQVPANQTGAGMILAVMQSVINEALVNGTIEVGKTLTSAQQLYITQATGSSTAWQQVQTQGYWVSVVIQQFVANGVTQYKAVYTLIYSKDDTIRQVIGSDIMI